MSPALDTVERIARTERFISYIRAGVVAFNVATYLAFTGTDTPRRALALLVCAGAIVYTIAMLAWKPSARSRTLLAAITGTVVDTLLIGVWLYATNGFESPYFPVLYAEAAATVGRFGVMIGIVSGIAAGGVYYVASALGAGSSVPGYEMSVRIAYIFAIIAFVGYVVDIARRSERSTAVAEAEASALREVDELRATFVTHISHELRTPLTAIRGAAITLNGKGAELNSDEAGILIDMIDRQSDRLSSLIEDIIDVGLIQEGRLSPRMTTVDLNGLLDRVVATANAEREHEIRYEGPDGEVRAVCDGPKIAGAVQKILDNAVKFSTPDQPIDVRLESDGREHVISVRDRGIGVSPEHRGKIFESFFQVDPTMTRAAPGTGIGLSIARAIFTMHGGDVEFRPEQEGSTFVLRLPSDGRTTPSTFSSETRPYTTRF